MFDLRYNKASKSFSCHITPPDKRAALLFGLGFNLNNNLFRITIRHGSSMICYSHVPGTKLSNTLFSVHASRIFQVHLKGREQ